MTHFIIIIKFKITYVSKQMPLMPGQQRSGNSDSRLSRGAWVLPAHFRLHVHSLPSVCSLPPKYAPTSI